MGDLLPDSWMPIVVALMAIACIGGWFLLWRAWHFPRFYAIQCTMMARVAAWHSPTTHARITPLAIIAVNLALFMMPAFFVMPHGDHYRSTDFSALSPGQWVVFGIGAVAVVPFFVVGWLMLSVSLWGKPKWALLPYLRDETQERRLMEWAAASPRSYSWRRPRLFPGDDELV